MVHDAVDHRCRHQVVTEDVAPAGEGQVRGQDQRGVFIAAGDELEEQIGSILFEGDVLVGVTDSTGVVEPIPTGTVRRCEAWKTEL